MPTDRTIEPRIGVMLNTGRYDPKVVEEADAADAANDVNAREYQEMDVETPINSQEMSAVMPFSFAARSVSPTLATWGWQ